MTGAPLRYPVVLPAQGKGPKVFSFAAKGRDVSGFARIERARRDGAGELSGFQRGMIPGHVHEIRDYLRKPGAVLPNPIVVGFTRDAGVVLEAGDGDGTGWVSIDASRGPPGWVVDGQQRLTALSEIEGSDFEVLVSGFLCDDVAELQKQFILINNTRPLPKALVYELLPRVEDLPPRMTTRTRAALMTEALNFREGSSLRGMIKQQTNPKGVIRDTVLQRVILTSLSDGALRLFASDDGLLLDRGVELLSEYFHAVRHVFRDEWEGHTPKTSRLLHGAGISAMGYVMERIHSTLGAQDRTAFASSLRALVGRTAWTSGEWDFGTERRRWNGLQNVPADYIQLADHLVERLGDPAPGHVVA